MPAHRRLRTDDRYHHEGRREATIELYEEVTIAAGEVDVSLHPALHHNELPPERRVLGFKSAVGLEERGRQARARKNRATIAASVS